MSAFYGRKVQFEWGAAEIDGAQEKNFTINGEAADISDDASDGVRMLMDEDAEVSIDIDIQGVTKSSALRKAKVDGEIQETATITWPDGTVVSCLMNLGAYTEGQPYAGRTTFTAAFRSSGPIMYTPPGP